jgi:hypothetical protein
MKYNGIEDNQISDFLFKNHISFNEYRQKYYSKLIDHLSGKNSMSSEEIEISLDALYSAIYGQYLNIHRLIKDIYLSLINIKYADYFKDQNVKCDLGIIFRIFDSIISLQEYKEDMIEEDAIEVYNELFDDKFMTKYEENDEFNYSHLFDINYHLNNLKQYSDDKKFLDIIGELLGRKGYR